MEQESLDQSRSVHLVLHSTQRQNVYCVEAFPPFTPSRGKAPRRYYQYFRIVYRRLGF